MWLTSVVLLAVYSATLAPDVTWWDAGEFIASFHALGIPHPPGTPLFVAVGHLFTLALGGILGFARASNLLSALCTALAGGLMAGIVVTSAAEDSARVRSGAVSAGLCAGLCTTTWSNATETEVYAFALLYVMIMLLAALRASVATGRGRQRWRWVVAYLLALGPAIHLSVMIAAPAIIFLATCGGAARERRREALLLTGTAVAAAGVGRTSAFTAAAGVLLMVAACLRDRRDLAAVALWIVASSMWLMLPFRALNHPAINQGNPGTISALLDVIGRRQYEAVPFWPRRAPLWIQFAAIPQYMDWQFAMTLGRGVFTSPARIAATLFTGALGMIGIGELRRFSRELQRALLVLFVCGSAGACVYLNLKAGNSIGYGIPGVTDHEARERDYFYIMTFWPWAVFVAMGATSLARKYALPAWAPCAVAFVPLLANWTSVSRARNPESRAPAYVAKTLLNAAPKDAVLFVAGDNDTYPLWYEQEANALRRDVTVVTLPLLPADWYFEQLAAAVGSDMRRVPATPGATMESEDRAGRLAYAARAGGRPVIATTQLTAEERDLLGSSWTLDGPFYVSHAPGTLRHSVPVLTVRIQVHGLPAISASRSPDDVSANMLATLQCGMLADTSLSRTARDSVAERCNFR